MKPFDFTAEFIGEFESLTDLSTATIRKMRRRYSKTLSGEDASYVLKIAHSIRNSGKYRWIACELIHAHEGVLAARIKREVLFHKYSGYQEFHSSLVA